MKSNYGFKQWCQEGQETQVQHLTSLALSYCEPIERRVIISAKWTKWMAQRTGQQDQFKTVKATDCKFHVHVPWDSPDTTTYKFFEKGTWPESRDPLNFWALNSNSSKTVKATCMSPGIVLSRCCPMHRDVVPVCMKEASHSNSPEV